ncbi:isocyanide synthase family protein [Allokutzneria sp. A3M-2-11 16]|uniref:L-tyrosine/L-tryptophan isonitrile synthase family protein n=1 Tax=Allokutzneria sp. A3M-2-11 16 TaxID=2962043 RepID=UPI0020B77AFF|nr:L-tyrosine/L-tryptophan isonitrile synthase family protein [Allokutzneria sp. A3M-2-11 16]MCP3804863.1 isocyanide synthase family protein [Allokutzneria sp. A3M-2-11 16]
MDAFIRVGEPIHFVIPAFPAKSPNTNKVLGKLPDLAERLALEFIQSFCDHISHFYPPGARVTICSDGHVFGDVVGVADDDVTAYHEELQRVLTASGWASVELYGLPEAFGRRDYPNLRGLLDRDYATPVDDLRGRVRREPEWRALFNGIHRFVFEDQVAAGAGRSRSKIRQEAKELAYQTIQRSNAWSSVVAERFPGALRLSIHPQAPHSEKIGFQLLRTKDNWLTPWHGVVFDNGVNFTLVKRYEAERMNASVIWRDNRPSHFVAPHLGPDGGLLP